MKIETKDSLSVCFEDIPPGGTFKHGRDYYLVTSESGKAVNLMTGHVFTFSPISFVEQVKMRAVEC